MFCIRQYLSEKKKKGKKTKEWLTNSVCARLSSGGKILTVPVQLCPSPVYPCLHVQTCDPCVFLQIAFV